MRPSPLGLALLTTAFFLLCMIQPSLSQIIGCDGPGIDCPAKTSAAKGGVCSYNEDGIGVVSFRSNITSDGPLTWTIKSLDDSVGGDPATSRTFFLGSPPTLNFEAVTNFEACTMAFAGVTSSLQLPSGFTDFGNFGCSTVMGATCAQDVFARVQHELLGILNDPSFDPETSGSPCWAVQRRLASVSLPLSCVPPLNTTEFGFGKPWSMFIHCISTERKILTTVSSNE